MRIADLFLYEAVEDFFESGREETKLMSCILKVIAVVELLLKEELESISQYLVLDRIDPIDLADLANFTNAFLVEPERSLSKKKTARFTEILNRAKNFIEISEDETVALKFLYDVRNNLSHYHGHHESDDVEVNRLLIEIIFPFIKRLLSRMQPPGISLEGRRWISAAADTVLWEKLSLLSGKVGMDLLLSKKIQYYKDKYSRDLHPPEPLEVPHLGGIWCPCCRDLNMEMILGLDVDWNPDGTLENIYRRLKCLTCNAELDEDEIREIVSHTENWIPEAHRASWNLEL